MSSEHSTVKPKSVCLVLLTAIALAACGDDETATDAAATTSANADTVVTIENFSFEPARVEIAAGTTIEWTNRDAFLHTVTSGKTSGPENEPDGRFDEELPDEGATASVTFDEPGTYTYYCRQHNAMDGTVVVT